PLPPLPAGGAPRQRLPRRHPPPLPPAGLGRLPGPGRPRAAPAGADARAGPRRPRRQPRRRERLADLRQADEGAAGRPGGAHRRRRRRGLPGEGHLRRRQRRGGAAGRAERADAGELAAAAFLRGGLSRYSTSKMHSISTAMLLGNAPMPTALRAPTPASSPKTSAISSLKPLITAGGCVKSGVLLTMPSVLTSRRTRSSEPSWSRTVARMFSPTARADSLPCSSVRSAPQRPVIGVFSPTFTGPWPET